MKIIIIILVVFSLITLCIAQGVQIIDDWYYIDGKKFFVKGIGYETHTRPGQVPWVYSFDADLINFDLQRIKLAGYNTIRTWGALTEEELQLVESSGLKILYGIWIDPHGDYGNPDFINAALDHVEDVLAYSAGYDCIIGYIIMNEPQVQHIYEAGAESLSDLWQSVMTLIHDKHPGIPVSFSNTMIGDYINMEVFDFAAYNAYIYNPVTITGSHGYAGYLSFLKENRSPVMPMIITEFGLSVSPGVSNPDYGYGGNTLEQQVSGNLLMYRELIDAGIQGGCVFQYHDGWWKGGDENVHDPVAEEYFGLIEFSGLTDNSWSYLGNFYMPVDTKVATFGAGFTIEYGKFSKVISNQKIMMNGNWADPIAAPELVTGINQGKSGSIDVAERFELFQNYPNPFNPETNISFTLAKTGNVILEVFDVTGQKIQTLLDEKKRVGFHQIRFRANNLSSGVYFCRIQTEEYSQVRKMIHLR